MNTAWDDIDQWDSWWSAQQFEWKLVRQDETYEVCTPRSGVLIKIKLEECVIKDMARDGIAIRETSPSLDLQDCWFWEIVIKSADDRTVFLESSGRYDRMADPYMTREECKKDAIFYCTRHLPHELKGGLMEAKKKTVDLAEAISILGLEVKTGG